MRRDAARIRLDQADDKVGVVDGSDWIKNQIRRQSLPLDDLGLDFYHLSENLHKTRRAVDWEEDPKDEQAPGNAWVGRLLHTAKHSGVRSVARATPGVEGRAAWNELPSGGGASIELRDGSSGDDPVSEVLGTGPADRKRADGVHVQGDDPTHQGSGDALGRGQC